MKYSEIMEKLYENICFLRTDNKNLTEEQKNSVYEIIDLLHELHAKIAKSKAKL